MNDAEKHIEELTGVAIPDTRLAKKITEFVKTNSTELLFNHSTRVYYFAAIRGKQLGLSYNPELLYAGTMFHDIGLLPAHCSQERFEVDGANAARTFLQQHSEFSESDIKRVWTSIALHTTPGIPCHMDPEIALVTEGVEMDVLGLNYDKFSDEVREAVVSAYPRGPHFKENIIDAFNDGIKHRPDTTFGNVKADVLAFKDTNFRPRNFCTTILSSQWDDGLRHSPSLFAR